MRYAVLHYTGAAGGILLEWLIHSREIIAAFGAIKYNYMMSDKSVQYLPAHTIVDLLELRHKLELRYPAVGHLSQAESYSPVCRVFRI